MTQFPQRNLSAALLAALLGLALTAASAPAAEMTAEQVVQGYLKATGYDALKGHDTVEIRGTLNFNGIDGPFVLQRKRPGHYRFQSTLEGREGVVGYDGEAAWGSARRGGFRAFDDSATAVLAADEGDFDGPLVKAKEKGHRLELLGTEDIDGTATYHLQVTLAGGKIQHWYLDTSTFLPVRKTTSAEHRRAGEYQRVYYFLEWADYGGVKLPSYYEREDRQHVRSYTLESVEWGKAIDAGVFAMPAAEPATP